MSSKTYVVEALLDSRPATGKGGAGRTEYLVKWRDYPAEDSTWEPEDHVSEKMIQAFNTAKYLEEVKQNATPRRASRGRKALEADIDAAAAAEVVSPLARRTRSASKVKRTQSQADPAAEPEPDSGPSVVEAEEEVPVAAPARRVSSRGRKAMEQAREIEAEVEAAKPATPAMLTRRSSRRLSAAASAGEPQPQSQPEPEPEPLRRRSTRRKSGAAQLAAAQAEQAAEQEPEREPVPELVAAKKGPRAIRTPRAQEAPVQPASPPRAAGPAPEPRARATAAVASPVKQHASASGAVRSQAQAATAVSPAKVKAVRKTGAGFDGKLLIALLACLVVGSLAHVAALVSLDPELKALALSEIKSRVLLPDLLSEVTLTPLSLAIATTGTYFFTRLCAQSWVQSTPPVPGQAVAYLTRVAYTLLTLITVLAASRLGKYSAPELVQAVFTVSFGFMCHDLLANLSGRTVAKSLQILTHALSLGALLFPGHLGLDVSAVLERFAFFALLLVTCVDLTASLSKLAHAVRSRLAGLLNTLFLATTVVGLPVLCYTMFAQTGVIVEAAALATVTTATVFLAVLDWIM